MKVEIVGKNLVITLPIRPRTPSKTGKSLIVAGSDGNKETTCQIDGKNIIVGVNAYIPTK